MWSRERVPAATSLTMADRPRTTRTARARSWLSRGGFGTALVAMAVGAAGAAADVRPAEDVAAAVALPALLVGAVAGIARQPEIAD